MVSLGTVETVELQFIIDQSLSPRDFFFIRQVSMSPVECGKWRPLPVSWVLWDRASEPQPSVFWSLEGFFFFFLSLQFIQNCFDFLKRLLSQRTMLLVWIVLCSSYLLSSNYAKAANSLYKESSGKQFENVTFLLPLQTSLQYDSNITQYKGNDNLLDS